MNKKSIYEDELLRKEIRMKAANDFEEKLSEDEISMCILTMERKRVSFFADHMWPNRRMGKLIWSLTADGRRTIGHQNGLAGMDPPAFVEATGEDAGIRPEVCRVTVYRKTPYNGGKSIHLCAYHGEARWNEFVGLKKSGEVNSQWKQRPYNQLAKCAEMQALRRGFPEGEMPDDNDEVIESDDEPLNEVDSKPKASPAPKPETKPEPKPTPDERPAPPVTEPAPERDKEAFIAGLRESALPLLKSYCDKLNEGKGLSWKAAYAKLTGVVGDKAMEAKDYETLIECLRDALEGTSA